MPLVKSGRVVEDTFAAALDGAPLPEHAAVLVPAARLIADADGIARRTAPTGVIWPNDRPVAELAPHLDRLAMVALVFPTFRDGRAYSQARQLRERYRYRGELRATGQVLRDQFLFLARSGFDAFEVSKPQDVSAFVDAMARYSVVYQPAADARVPALRLRRAPDLVRERAVAQRLGEMHAPDLVRAVEVGERARDPQDAMVAAGA
jgi:uncharacterized protein (DUF934 family)